MPQGSPECDACLEQNCCTELAACVASSECGAVLGCLSMCAVHPEPDICPGRCFGNGEPPPLFQSFLECLISSCQVACTMLSGG
jgi:hypothetical protein